MQTTTFTKNIQEWIFPLLSLLIGVVFLTLFAKIRIPLGFTPVPITLQTLGFLVLGRLLGPKEALKVSSFYVFLAFLGFPVLSTTSSYAALFSYGAGYVIGFIPLSVLAALSQNQPKVKAFLYLFSACLIQLFMGTLYLSFTFGIWTAFCLGFFPFVLGETLKIFMVYFLTEEFFS